MQQDRPRKLQRISQACDLCHRRSIRCRPSNEDGDRCQNCYDFDVACTYDRPSKRRKHPQAPIVPQQSSQKASSSTPSSATQAFQNGVLDFTTTNDSSVRNDSIGKANEFGTGDAISLEEGADIELSWRVFALSNEVIVLELFDVYMEVVYPLYPFFHEASEKQRLKNRDYLRDRGFFASTMALCAVASARIRDGALPRKTVNALDELHASSEVFFAAAKSIFATDLGKLQGFEYIRACSLLALTCIQYNDPTGVQQYLGYGATIVSMQRFYDERFWPDELTDTQRETYRRLFWGTYSFEIYSTNVWNCFMRFQEIHASVRYPSHLDEEMIRCPYGAGWLVGWNFTIDLYRVLEHVLNKARAKKFQHDDRRTVDSLVFQDTFSDKDVMTTMLNMYYSLPPEFKSTPPMSGDRTKDIYAFQAANIQATLQLLRMMLFSMEDGPGVDRKCDVANEVLSVFHTIPTTYLRGISTPLVYQIGRIGQILGSVFEHPLSQQVYERVRSSLFLMAELLKTLESSLKRSAGASHGLLVQVEKIDQFIQSQQSAPQPPAAQSAPLSIVDTQIPLPLQGIGTGPEIQVPPELGLEWPWPLYQNGPYYLNNNY